ncbi:GlsB/YeaQ/YmgE family stress response membrane protein [Mycobacterium stomatepiae]|uniref:GlsB/YeaQ/YmgE family stress response membrane protein n=1 Tax=Mycobacterium stomatepiae TaxID=470076 RepID=A0A7I7Q3C4_9MYCO|nr:GlsB/YeaQ/YmgE family stress response membrane protein [Mycobacterium stomatepiae]MCV7165236.1 GlsB/YeaQ/YmgE family stress response membrane protein [Mycobacterium stomatepiae]BBY20527.1 hypothetical protein MSTO_07320 [Mycobacterium stomatepiae]
MRVIAASQYLALSPPTAVSWLAYLVIGGFAGWIAGKIVKGGGAGILLHVDVEHGRKWFTFFTALLGSVILLWIVGMVRKR